MATAPTHDFVLAIVPDSRSEARAIFVELMREIGKAAFHTPMTFNLYLRQRLADHDAERVLLSRGLEHGVPDSLLKFACGDFAGHVQVVANRFAIAAAVDATTAYWVCEAWAAALGRPLDYVPPPPALQWPDPTKLAISDKSVRWVMALLVGFGGFLGSAIGGAVVPALALGAFSVYQTEAEAAKNGSLWTALAIYMIRRLVYSVIVGASATAAWLLGRGDEWPWGGFGAAFGAAFGAQMLRLNTAIGLAAGVMATFGATYTFAVSAGQRK